MDRAVICFTRAPVPGRTKTRLMPLLSGEACAELHAAFLRDVARVCRETGAAVYVAYTPVGGRGLLADIFPFARDLFLQEGADLGERRAAAMDRVLAMGHSPCVLIGSDLPLLTAAHLNEAFAALEGADATLGPTPDGGYYLVGLKRPCPSLFTGKRYGSGGVYGDAVAALEAAGRSFAPAPSCADVDTPEDLRALRHALAGAESHTARCLRQLFPTGGAL